MLVFSVRQLWLFAVRPRCVAHPSRSRFRPRPPNEPVPILTGGTCGLSITIHSHTHLGVSSLSSYLRTWFLCMLTHLSRQPHHAQLAKDFSAPKVCLRFINVHSFSHGALLHRPRRHALTSQPQLTTGIQEDFDCVCLAPSVVSRKVMLIRFVSFFLHCCVSVD